MNTNTQPSEHAMRAAKEWCMPQAKRPVVDSLAQCIDQHAIAPAVAERDKRIAELEQSLAYFRSECINLTRKNIELVRGAPLERVLSPNDTRVTDYHD